MAPELFQVSGTNAEAIDLHKTDIWSLGVTLYFMVMGRTPWQVGNEIELAHCVQNMTITFPDEKVDPHLKHLLREMLDRNYHTRIDLNGVITDDWVTAEGTDPLFTEQDIIAEEQKPHTGHILLIENNVAVKNVISIKLDQANCTHIVAASAAEGVLALKQNISETDPHFKFACVFVAKDLSDGSGIDLVPEIKKLGFKGRIVGIVGESDTTEFDSCKSELIRKGCCTVWSYNHVKSIDIMQLLSQQALERGESKMFLQTPRRDPPGAATTTTSNTVGSSAIPSNSYVGDSPICQADVEAAIVQIKPSPALTTIGSRDSFGISEISSRTESPGGSDFTSISSAEYRPILQSRLSRKGTLEASFMMHDADFHLGNSLLPRVNSIEPYNMARKGSGRMHEGGGGGGGMVERKLSRTRDFMLVPADIVLIPSKDKKGVEKSIAYKGVDASSTSLALRKLKREKAMQKSKQKITKMVTGYVDRLHPLLTVVFRCLHCIVLCFIVLYFG